jgi:carbamoyltransferase
MANILGLHFGHDSSVALVKDGRLISAISLERITRIKKHAGMTIEAIDYVLSQANISIKDIDAIGVSDYSLDKAGQDIRLYINNLEIQDTNQKLFGNEVAQGHFIINNYKIPAFVIAHQLSHCSSAFYTSNFDKSYCFSVDSSGGHRGANSLIAFGNGKKIDAVACPNLMIGNAYAMFTQKLGIGDPLYKAGSTMGLACYGKIISKVLNNKERYTNLGYTEKDFIHDELYRMMWLDIAESPIDFEHRESDSLRAMNIAATIQYIFENCILDTINNIENTEGVYNLCLSGGSMLNCNTNSLILNKSKYKNLHLFPACGDDGICVGAALYVAHNILGEERFNYQDRDICYLGKNYSENEIDIDADYISSMLSKGKIIGWYQGRSEYGPRALGNRSILADPRNFHNREIINFIVKRREWYRPFAPSVLQEKCSEWFDFENKSPFMLFTADVKRPKDIPAITHVDNSARMQTVSLDLNKNYYNMIKSFYEKTQVPMVLNTSLNCNGEPIVETIEDAERFFKNTPVDIMVINNKIMERN